MKTLNIGLVGYGFMGRTHSNAFLQAPRFFDLPFQPVLKAVSARNEERVKKFAANWGYESYETDWRKLIERKDIDVIDIASPNDTHREIAIAAAQAGKMVMCEKPLGRTAAEARAMVDAVEKAGVPNTVWYNYRRVPAVMLIKQLLDEGTFGRIFHYRAKFLQDWTISQDLPQGGEGLWRLDVSVAGSGVTGDLLAHNIDTALYTLEVNGADASAFWDLHDLHRLQYFDHHDEGRVRGWRNVHITDGDQPYMKHWWVPGLQIGYEHTFIHQFADFVEAVGKGKSLAPTFRDGLATDCVTDAILK